MRSVAERCWCVCVYHIHAHIHAHTASHHIASRRTCPYAQIGVTCMELFIIAASLVPASDSLNRILAPTPRVINHLCRVDQLAHIVQVRDRCLATRCLAASPSRRSFSPVANPSLVATRFFYHRVRFWRPETTT